MRQSATGSFPIGFRSIASRGQTFSLGSPSGPTALVISK